MKDNGGDMKKLNGNWLSKIASRMSAALCTAAAILAAPSVLGGGGGFPQDMKSPPG